MNKYLDKFYLGTWNLRSLYITGALAVVTTNLDRYRIEIAAIKEVKTDWRWKSDYYGNIKRAMNM